MIKKISIILILIICLFTISAVSAEEIGNETNNPISMDNNVPNNEHIDEQAVVSNEIVGENNNGESSANEVSCSEINEKIGSGENIDLIAPDVTKYYMGPERFIITLENNSDPIPYATVKITLNGITYNRTTNSFGQASMGIALNSGVYDVTTEYNDIKVYSTVTVKDTVIADDFTKMYKNGTQYYGTFVDSLGNVLKGETIRININGVYYYKTTDNNGIAKMNINLIPGTYILTVDNPVSGERHATTVTVLSTIVENHDLTKYYRNASQYSLRLLGPDGKPVGAGEVVTFNINGVFYKRTSDSSGYVRMNINLPPGTYVITADYNGLKASNIITVKSVLFANDLNMKYRDGSCFEVKVLDGQGEPLDGATVTFNVNGVFYSKVTDGDGIARLTINLPAGNYIITSSFNGLNAANSITISYDFWHLPDSADPYPEVGRINYGNGWVGQIYNDNYRRTINLNTLEVHGSYGDFTALGVVMVVDDGRYYYYDNGDYAYHGENYDTFNYHPNVQWW